MYAYFASARHRRLRLWQEEILGMPLLRVELPEKVTPRGQRKLECTLARIPVHRLLNLPDGWESGKLPTLSETRNLWLLKARDATLQLLEVQGLSPSAATVEVRGNRLTPECRRLIVQLLPCVRAVSLAVPADEDFLWYLQRSYGVSPRSGQGDVAVCFSPAQRALSLPLWADRPVVEGLHLTAALDEIPADCPMEPLLAALVAQGRIASEQIQICTIFA